MLEAALIGMGAKVDNSVALRTVTHQGIKHLVAPVVLINVGVHHGSNGPILYTEDELKQFPAAWNGRPLTIDHPPQGASANSPEFIEHQAVGMVWNVRFANSALRGDLYVNIRKCEGISPAALGALREGKLEVSTGLWESGEDTSGTFKGESYGRIARNIRPDHLALLPDAVGACSWRDGCGAPRNEGIALAGNIKHRKDGPWMDFTVLERIDNRKSFEDIHNAIQAKLDNMDVFPRGIDQQPTLHFLVATFRNNFIFRKEGPDGSMLFRQAYTVSTDGTIEFAQEVIEVTEETSFKEVSNKSNGEEEPETMEKGCERVKALVASGQFAEGDIEMLESMSPDQLEKVEALAKKEAASSKAETESKAVADAAETKFNELVETNKAKGEEGGGEADPVVDEDKPMTMEQYLDKAPNELKGIFATLKDEHDTEKETLVGLLDANKECEFTADQLKAMDIRALRAMHRLSGGKPEAAAPARQADYTGASGGSSGGPTTQKIGAPKEIDWTKVGNKAAKAGA